MKILSGGQDSNLRPLAPHASALPGCATTRFTKDLSVVKYWAILRLLIMVYRFLASGVRFGVFYCS